MRCFSPSSNVIWNVPFLSRPDETAPPYLFEQDVSVYTSTKKMATYAQRTRQRFAPLLVVEQHDDALPELRPVRPLPRALLLPRLAAPVVIPARLALLAGLAGPPRGCDVWGLGFRRARGETRRAHLVRGEGRDVSS